MIPFAEEPREHAADERHHERRHHERPERLEESHAPAPESDHDRREERPDGEPREATCCPKLPAISSTEL